MRIANNSLYGLKGHILESVVVLSSIILADPSQVSLVVGAFISCFGLGLRIWTQGFKLFSQPAQEATEPTVTGPYGYVQQPYLLGTLLMLFGFCLASRSILVSLTMFVGFFLVWGSAIRGRNAKPQRSWDSAYSEFVSIVPRFIPSLIPYRGRLYARQHYSLKQAFFAKRHHEFAALVVALFVFLSMIVIGSVVHNDLWRGALGCLALIYGIMAGIVRFRNAPQNRIY